MSEHSKERITGANIDSPLCLCPECGHIDTIENFDVGGADEGNLFCNRCHHEGDMEFTPRDKKGATLSELPADLRVREMPEVRR